MEGLVYVGKIVDLQPIENADLILLATADCGKGGVWRGIVKKDVFEIDGPCTVYLPDSVVPPNPELSFLKDSNWRVKMRKFRGAPSESLIIEYHGIEPAGFDLTHICGVTRYIKEIPPCLAGEVVGEFPSFVPRTDEPNWQISKDLVDLLKGNPYYITEKVDGSSSTAYKWQGRFGVCNRNWELVENEENGYWKIANRFLLKEVLPDGYAIQWETCGPGINKNSMKLQELTGLAFSVYSIEDKRYLDGYDFIHFCQKIGFPTVNIVVLGDEKRPFTDCDLNELARGKYAGGRNREGIVIRSWVRINGKIISFKALNLEYDH